MRDVFLFLLYAIVHTIITNIIMKRVEVKDESLSEHTSEIERIKEIKYKSLEEQMKYVTYREDLGQNYIYFVLNSVVFYFAYSWIISPLITGVVTGVIYTLLSSIILSYFTCKYVLPTKYFKMNMIGSILSLLFVGVFLTFVKFNKALHPLLLLLLTLIVMFIVNKLWGKLKNGSNHKDRT